MKKMFLLLLVVLGASTMFSCKHSTPEAKTYSEAEYNALVDSFANLKRAYELATKSFIAEEKMRRTGDSANALMKKELRVARAKNDSLSSRMQNYKVVMGPDGKSTLSYQ